MPATMRLLVRRAKGMSTGFFSGRADGANPAGNCQSMKRTIVGVVAGVLVWLCYVVCVFLSHKLYEPAVGVLSDLGWPLSFLVAGYVAAAISGRCFLLH